jgi:hypothetical protein
MASKIVAIYKPGTELVRAASSDPLCFLLAKDDSTQGALR